MRKNKMMRLASLLLVLTLMSTCAISGTFAKYVTDGTRSDNARVAKWGVEVTAYGDAFADAFAEEYDSDTEGYAPKTVVSSVLTAGETKGENVVAPGTGGDLATSVLAGTPEVAVKVEYTATVTLGDNWEEADGAFYCPLVFTVNGVEVKQDATNDSAEKLEDAIEAAIAESTAEYAAGTDLSKIDDTKEDLTVSWAWPYSTGADNDEKDTYLGDQAAEGNAATVTVEIVTTVTQID